MRVCVSLCGIVGRVLFRRGGGSVGAHASGSIRSRAQARTSAQTRNNPIPDTCVYCQVWLWRVGLVCVCVSEVAAVGRGPLVGERGLAGAQKTKRQYITEQRREKSDAVASGKKSPGSENPKRQKAQHKKKKKTVHQCYLFSLFPSPPLPDLHLSALSICLCW